MLDPYRPEFFRAPALGQLERLAADPATQTFDTIRIQIRDLMKTRHPKDKLPPAELQRLADEHLRGVPEREYGVWVYYPWSRRLVHLLGEDEFAELRTNRNYYKITPAEQRELATKRVGVVGLSVGQSVSLVLALERSFGELRLADFDTLDLSNLNRLRSPLHHLGVPKAVITAREIAEIDPFLKVACFGEGITDENIEAFLTGGGNLDLLIEECDSLDKKVELRYAARRHRIPVLMDTSDRGMLDIERFDLEPRRPLFHGLAGDLEPSQLRGLTAEEKVPYVLRIIGLNTISPRLRGSLMEVEQSISTWPQLASSVTIGGGAAADVARRILLGHCRISGKFFVDIEQIVPDAPPATTSSLPVEKIRRLVEAATWAPSGGNAQPWRWKWDGRDLFLYLDPARSRSLLDYRSLASYVALGAATENLVLSAHEEGLGAHIASLPLGSGKDPAVVFEFGPAGDAPPGVELARWIPVRVTNRRNPGRAPVPAEVLDRLNASVAGPSGARLRWLLDDRALEEAGEILGAADRLMLLNQTLHGEMLSEVRFDPGDQADCKTGIPIDSLELSPADRAGIEICRSWEALDLVRKWGGGGNLEKMARQAIAGSSAVGMLTLPGTEAADYFAGGRVLQRFWLSVTSLDFAIQPMTALSYLFARMLRGNGEGLAPETQAGLQKLRPRWTRLFDLTGSEAEVLVFKLSPAMPVTCRATRLSVDDVLEIEV
jgi:molybdopterin/thiamine biosynthesis adenylyltransferase